MLPGFKSWIPSLSVGMQTAFFFQSNLFLNFLYFPVQYKGDKGDKGDKGTRATRAKIILLVWMKQRTTSTLGRWRKLLLLDWVENPWQVNFQHTTYMSTLGRSVYNRLESTAGSRMQTLWTCLTPRYIFSSISLYVLAPTGALYVMMPYHLSSGNGHFFRF